MSDRKHQSTSRAIVYCAMLVLLVGIFIGAFSGAPSIFLAVGFIGEIVLGATAHLSTVIEQNRIPQAGSPQ